MLFFMATICVHFFTWIRTGLHQLFVRIFCSPSINELLLVCTFYTFCRWLFLLTVLFFVILRLELDWHLSKSISHKTCQLCISIRAQEIHFYSFLKMLMKNQMHCFKLHSWSGLISYRIICQFNSSNLLPAVK